MMRVDEDVEVYLHRAPVDFRNYAESKVMRSNCGERLCELVFGSISLRIIIRASGVAEHR